MLKKLLKYDIADLKKLWIIISIVNVATSTVAALLLRHVLFYANEVEPTALGSLIMVLEILVIFASVTWLAASGLVINIKLFVNYYNRCFTDEGYLTFTLPVSRKTLFLSKTLNSLIWTGLHNVVVVLCVLIVMLIAPVPESGELINTVVFSTLGDMLSLAAEQVGAWVGVEIFLGVVILLLYQCVSLMLMHYSATAVGVGRSKIFIAILVWLGLSYGAGIVISVIVTNMGGGLAILLDGLGTGLSNLVAVLFMLLIVIIELAISAFLYFASLDRLEHKLNLS